MDNRRIPFVDRVKAALSSSAVVLVDAPLSESRPSFRPLSDWLFDDEYYAERYPEAVLEVRYGNVASLRAHYEKRGFLAGFRPSAVFVPSAYALDPRSRYSDSEGVSPVEHYLSVGCAERASPHWMFDEIFYVEEYPDVARAIEAGTCASGFHHFLSAGIREGRRPHPLFNRNLYRELNGIRAEDAHFLHYARTGAFREALSSGLFDPEWYAYAARDVVAHVGENRDFDCLLHHFLQFGMREGRAPVPDFDADYYLRRNDVARREIEEGKYATATEHWVRRGCRLGMAPNPFFDPGYYAHANPEVIPEIAEYGLAGAFEHFSVFGRKRGLRCNPPLFQLPLDEEQAKVAYARRARTSALLSRARPRASLRPRQVTGLAPDVSIVIPVKDHSDFTFHLLSDLSSRRYDVEVEIVVVDDASSDETRELSSVFPDVRVLRNETSVGFPAACNQGFQASSGRVVIFANNDIEVSPGSIDAMMRLLDSEPDIAVVGPRVLRMHGRLQEAGSAVFPDGSTAGHGRDDDPDAPRYGWVQDVHYCSAVFLAVRRSTLEELGGFDESYSPGYYEEVELCSRVWAAGQRVVVEPSAVVHHFEHASFARGRPPSAAAVLMHRHRHRFSEASKSFLSSCTPRLPSSPVGSVGYARGRESVLLIEDYLPLPAIGSGFPRANRIVHALVEMGYHVVVYAIFRRPGGTWLDARERLPPVEVYYDDEAPHVLQELLATREFAAVWMCRTHNIERVIDRLQMVKTLRRRPLLVLDTEALAANRTAVLRGLIVGSEMTGAEPDRIRQELSGADAFDCVVAVSEGERRQIAQALVKQRVVVVGHEAPPPLENEQPSFEARHGFLFVGSVHSELSPNHEGLSWFVRDVWPEILSREPTATLTIAGYWDAKLPRPAFASAPGVRFLGEVADLGPLYARARVFVAPIRFAAGIPLKVQEATARGVPCAVTRVLAWQIGLRHEQDAVVGSALDPEEFARCALDLYRSRELWTRVRDGGQVRARDDWSTARFVEGIRTALGVPNQRGHLLS